jgi:hypothetical protein
MLSRIFRVRLDTHTAAQLRDFADTWQQTPSAVIRDAVCYLLEHPAIFPDILSSRTPDACEDMRNPSQVANWKRDAETLTSGMGLAALLADHGPV